MAYIGQAPFQEFTSVPTKDNFTGDGSTTAFDLSAAVPVGSENALEVFVANVRQEPGSGKAFTLGQDGNGDYKRITFSSAPSNSAAIYVINDRTSFTSIAPLPQDLNGSELILDADADTSITASTDDQIDIKIGGADDFTFTANAFNVLTGSHFKLADSSNVQIGTGSDMNLYHDGTNSYVSNSTGALKIATETSGIAVTIGHTTSETTIADNLTVTGNASIGGNFDVTGTFDMSDANITNIGSIALDTITNDGTDITLDSSGDIVLDADGDNITLKAGGTTYGDLAQVGGELVIKSGSTPTTALTFSGANATFAGSITGNLTGNASGTALTVTQAAQSSITSLGTLTALTVDDVAVDGKVITMTGSASDTAVLTAGTNGTLAITTTDAAAAAANITITADGTFEAVGTTITLDSGGAINLEPESGSAILLDGTISVDAGVVTGATSITSTAFVGALTGNASGTAATVTGAAQSNITSLGTLTALTVDDVAIDGKVITMTGSSGDTFTTTVATNGATTLTTVDTAAAAANITITADGTAELAGTTVTLNSAGGVTLDADNGTITFADAGSSLGTITSSGYSGTAAAATTVTITDNESTDEGNAIVFVAGADTDGGTGLGLESDGHLTYNPSSGTLTCTNLVTSGTHTVTDSVTMTASNAVVFEGSTADAYETTLTTIDTTGSDKTISLPNVSGTLPVLAAVSATAITATPAELNYVDGVTSAIQTQLNAITANDWVTTARINGDAITGAELADNAVDSEHYTDASIDEAHLSDNSVDSRAYVDGSIDLVHMSANSVDSDQYVDGSIDLVHMSANSVDSDQYVDGSIDTAHIANDQITAALMADNSIDSDMYVDGSIDTAHIANDQITAALMADNSIDSDMYVDGSIDTAHIANDQITAALMADNSIDSDMYVDGSIDTAHIANDAITAALIADDVINSEHYAAGSIDNEHIADDAINSEHYADGSIDTAHIADLNVTGAKLALDHRSAASTDDVISGNQHDYIYYDADVGMRFYTANAEDMRLEDDGDLHVDADVIAFSTTISDERLKENITPIQNALSKVNQLHGMTFTYTPDGKESAGLIAQDVEKVLPSAVSEKKLPLKKDDGQKYKVLEYNQTIGLLVESIKELTAKVEKLESRKYVVHAQLEAKDPPESGNIIDGSTEEHTANTSNDGAWGESASDDNWNPELPEDAEALKDRLAEIEKNKQEGDE